MKIIGIDLGTTKSVVGFMYAGEPVIIPDAQGRTSIPSLVLVTPSEEIFVGHAAKKHPDFFHGKSITISSVKRLMGKQGETGWGWWKTFPQEVSAFILSELKSQAEMYLEEEVKEAVIAIPSHFDESQRRATKEAASIAGLIPLRLLNEANAAALAYGFDLNRDERILVFDFGGGTLDIAILEMGEGVFEVKSIAGDSKLGGDDFDEIIYNYLLEQCRQEHGASLELTPAQVVFLQEAARRAKVELSQLLRTTMHYPAFFKLDNHYADLRVSIDRSTFERLSQPLFDRTVNVLKKALEGASLGSRELDRVLLLGGSSRIPYVGAMIKKELGITPFRGVDPELAVAQGAVIQAGMLRGEVKDVLLLDVIPGSYGIETLGGVFSRIIRRNTTIPTRQSFITTTTQDNQRSVAIRVFQGERDMAADNLYLETIVLEGIPPAPKGIPQIEVTLDIDANMIVHAFAKDMVTGRNQKARVQSPYGLNEAQIKLMMRKIMTWLAHRKWEGFKEIALKVTQAATDLLRNFPQALSGEVIENLQNERSRLLTYMNNEDISENPSAALARFEKIYQEAKLLVARYEEQIKEIDTLRRKIDSYIGDSPNDIGPVGSLLIQGKELLLDFQNRRVPFDELQNLFLSVRTEYENARALLLSSLLTQFMDSDETVQWELDIPKVISLSHSREQHLARLQDFTYVQQIIGQFDDNESDYQKLILQKTFKRVENNSRAISFLILLTTAFAGLCYDQLPHDFLSKSVTEATLLSAFGLFTVGLQPDMPEPHRKAAAGWISQLSLQEYLSVVTDSCLIEASPVVKEALLLYLNKHPEGTFWGFFLFASPEIRKAICHDIYLIERLLMEPQENSDLFTLVFLGNVSGDWFDWVIQFLPRLAGTSNSKVRSKVLDYIVQMEYKGDQVREIIATLLYDPEIEIRVAAYKYIAKLNDESFLPKVYESIMEEKSEFVEQEAIFALGELTSPASVHYILLLSLEPNNKLRNLAFTVLANKDIIDKDYRKLFELIKKVVQRKHSLGLLDKFMLNRMRKRSSNLGEVVQRLLKFRDPTS